MNQRGNALLIASVASACVVSTAGGGANRRTSDAGGAATVAALVREFDADDDLLADFEPIETDAARDVRRRRGEEAAADAAKIDAAGLPVDARVDLHLFLNDLAARRARLDWEDEDGRQAAPLMPFLEAVVRLERSDRAGEPWASQELAAALTNAAKKTRELRESESTRSAEQVAALEQPLAVRHAAARARECQSFLSEWKQRNLPADPILRFWVETPASELIAALAESVTWFQGTVLEELKKKPEGSPFAIGPERYAAELRFEGIELTPEQMLEFGEEQLAALQAEMTRETEKLVATPGFAPDELTADLRGRAVDWRLGLELAKRDTVEVGGQRLFVQEVALASIRLCRERSLFPIPELAEQCWRLKLSDLETQKTYAYGYYGANFMGVASPVPDMDQERKLECLRSNARPFTRTVVPHELIPGHHLQGFFAKRRPERRRYHSPFFGEGWALHGEMTFDEHGFFPDPRARIGHLFWRLLRAARIVVSTRYHLRQMTQAVMVDFMVENAGLEKSAAQAEVDRYMTYSPLYQCAYLYGATQIRSLREECRTAWGAEFSELRFNTELVEQGTIPIRFARQALLGLLGAR